MTTDATTDAATDDGVAIHFYASVGRHGEVLHVGHVHADPDLTEDGYVAAFGAAFEAFARKARPRR
jgi:hypothetical protein